MPLWKETPGSACSLSIHRHQRKTLGGQERGWPSASQEESPCQKPKLRSSTSWFQELWGNKLLLLQPPSLRCFVTAAEQTETIWLQLAYQAFIDSSHNNSYADIVLFLPAKICNSWSPESDWNSAWHIEGILKIFIKWMKVTQLRWHCRSRTVASGASSRGCFSR